MSALEKFGSLGIVRRKTEVGHVTDTFKSLAVKAATIEAKVTSLSGGNQQKVVLSRALLAEPRLIVADEPTQGVDVGAAPKSIAFCARSRSSGTPIVVNSSDAAELEGLCDKVVVLSRGRVVETLTGRDVVEANIVAAAVSAEHHVDAGEGDAASQRRWRPERLATLPPDGQRAGRSSCDRHRSPCALRIRSESEFPVVVQRLQHPHPGDGARLYRSWTNNRASVVRCRFVGGAAGGLSGRGCVVFRERRPAAGR